jgi:Skp family chaperone for outer membrane proteins
MPAHLTNKVTSMRNKNLGLWCVAGLFCGSVLWFIGCNRGNSANATSEAAPAQSTVGVVNFETVARDLGWTDKMNSNIETYKNQLKSQVEGFATHYRARFDEQQKAFTPKPGDKLTPSQADQLQRMYVAIQQEVNQLQQQANQSLYNYRMEMFKRYREALTPIVRQVAESKKMTMALAQTDAVIFADPTVDLSNAVTDSARAHMPSITEVPMTSLQAPELPVNGSTTQPTTSTAPVPATTNP